LIIITWLRATVGATFFTMTSSVSVSLPPLSSVTVIVTV
jgi:hypothetical protein